MHLIFVVLFSVFQSFNSKLEGNWKLSEFTGFTLIMVTPGFTNLTEDEKLRVFDSMQFTLDNTYYNFKGDSLFFTNAGGDLKVTEMKGRFLIKSDTLMVFESGKVNLLKFFITSLEEEEFKMKVVRKDGSLGPTEMTFGKVK
jgi:hypothetical protein